MKEKNIDQKTNPTNGEGKSAVKEPSGSVMVVGAGIAGIQASLDLAEAGFYVHLVEKSPVIGGVMAQLDKTFPTNDCAMCIISPKLVECGRHLNINIIAYSDIEKIEGEPGHFKVRLKKRSRFIDEAKCTGCGECVEVCPVQVPSEFDMGLSERKAIYRPYPQAFPNVFTINKMDRPPCVNSCPAGTNIQGYVALIARGKYPEAVELIREKLPFPRTLGRICSRPCEAQCRRDEVEEPVAIRALKRFVCDLPEIEPWDIAPGPDQGKNVAIVGGGPAGMTAAIELRRMGYAVTLFESGPALGGTMRTGIPEFRLPRDVLDDEVQVINRMGVNVHLNATVGKDIELDRIQKDHDAVFLAIGAQLSARLRMDGEDLSGVLHGLDFLRRVNAGERPSVGHRVLVIGGGNVAVDVAQASLRLGAREVSMACLEKREEMPAFEDAIQDVLEEGVNLMCSLGPRRFLSENGRVTGLEMKWCVSVFDEQGRFSPKFDESRLNTLEADTIIVAIGQQSDTEFARKALNLDGVRGIPSDPVTFQTSVPNVFAGGDVVSGPASVVQSIAHGREVAISIDRFFRGEDLREGREKVPKGDTWRPIPPREPKKPRTIVPTLPVRDRIHNFEEMELSFNQEQAVTEALRCLSCGICSECMQCEVTCKAEAVNHNLQDQMVEMEVGSVILSPGFNQLNPELKGEYGYGRYPNVITSLEFERILSASGPFQGEVRRPSDRSHPRKVAWIQCVGSRDKEQGNEYCSAACCMYATKEAIIAREHDANIEPTVFYMDIRAHGKEFDSYYERAKNEYSVRYIRSMISKVVERPRSRNLLITYVDEQGNIREEEFDLVVLSVGMVPSPGTRELAEKLDVDLDRYGFCKTDQFNPVGTSRPGVFVAGVWQGPKDIPETVAQASGAAAYAAKVIAPARGTLTTRKEYPAESQVEGEEPRIGVFVCNCGINIGGVVNVPEVAEFASRLPHVVVADHNLYTCSQDTQEKIKNLIEEHRLNRVIVASCSPRTHEPLFQETIREAGLNKYLFEMANIRDQCSWVHMQDKERATQKAKDLVKGAVANAALIRPLHELPRPVKTRGLVIGGGLAGMTAALNLADQGFDVSLIEKEGFLGGNLHRVHTTLQGHDVRAYLRKMEERVRNHRLIQVFANATVVDFSGYKGNFTTEIMIAPGAVTRKIEHGVVIVATGGEEMKPGEFHYGEDPRIITQLELEEKIATQPEEITAARRIVMIQCVGSRESGHPSCSRICCQEAVKNALKIKELNPDAQVIVLYRDLRTYGLMEEYYTKARKEGVLFIRYEPEDKPQVELEQGKIAVTLTDLSLMRTIQLQPDLLVLSAGIVPAENEELATMLKVSRTSEEFFLEAHMKLRPVDFSTDGIYLCGMAHSPKLIGESIAQAAAAASRASTILSKEEMQVGGVVAVVNEDLCAACLTCVRACAYNVPVINERGKAEIEMAKCQGCGTCVAECPGKAIELQHYTDVQIIRKCAAILEEVA
ncbi:MAG: FAD-dependent oxidoreductase [Deltaproteobacteria bacterium]|nr:FAD-dependent oxidoreductase [Deltaproteobacteria bacterium]MBW2307557.1 FAD-dependent oxidoreductase [Deltaproteobacteria bacterium]